MGFETAGAGTHYAIDVDQYEEHYQDQPTDDAPGVEQSVATKVSQINTYMQGGRQLEALPVALEKLPFGTNPSAAKEQNFTAVLNLLLAIPTKSIPDSVKKLDQQQIDELTNYVYAGFERAQEGHAHLLQWHAAIVDAPLGGRGALIRSLCHRQLAI
eukprot:Clim_evm99s25 gene=Clim_evmTU99s25